MIKATVVVSMNKLPEIGSKTQAQIRQALLRAGYTMEGVAKERVPVLTGNLRRSITTQLDPGGMSVSTGASANYAEYIEFGTKNRSPKPFLTPGYAIARVALIDELSRIVK